LHDKIRNDTTAPGAWRLRLRRQREMDEIRLRGAFLRDRVFCLRANRLRNMPLERDEGEYAYMGT